MIKETLNRLIRALRTRERVELPRAELSGLSPEIAALADPSKQESAELAGILNHLAEVVEQLANIEIPDEVDEDEGDDQRIELLEQQIYLLTEQVALLLPEDEGAGSEPLIAHDRGRVRVGKIDSHSGSGVYVVTQQEWSGSAWQAVPSDHPMYQVSCRDLRARTTGSAADVVTLWQQLDSSGELEVVCNILPADTNTDEKVKACSVDPATDYLDQQMMGDGRSIEVAAVDSTIPDLTLFSKTDSAGWIAETATTVTVTDLAKTADVWLYYDYGAGYFTDSLTHRLKTECTAASGAVSNWTLWALSNVVNNDKYWDDNDSQAVILFWYTNTGKIYLNDREDNTGDSCATVAMNTPYWLTISRSGTTISVVIYSDSGRTTAVDTITTTLASGRSYRYLFTTNTYTGGAAATISGELDELSLGAAADWKVKVSGTGDDAAAFTKDFWFHITADKAWQNVDSVHDYRNRWISAFGVWDSGAPVEGGSWNELDVEVLDTEGATWVPVADALGLAKFVTNNTAADHEIIHCHRWTIGTGGAALGDFEIQVEGKTGNLQARSINYQGVAYQFRVHLSAFEQLAATDDYNIA